MSERTLLKKVNDLKALEAQKKVIKKQMADIQEDIKKELQASDQEETEVASLMTVSGVLSDTLPRKSFQAALPDLLESRIGPSFKTTKALRCMPNPISVIRIQ